LNPFTGEEDDDDEGAELVDDGEPFEEDEEEEEDGKRIPCSAIILCSQYVFNSSLFSMMDEVSTKEDVVTFVVEGEEGKVVLVFPSSVKEGDEEERGLFSSKGMLNFFFCDLVTRGYGRGGCFCCFCEE
jgi:hypothetical protein